MPNNQTADERFRALFEANRGAILAFAMRRADSAEEAADVVAETFTTAWRRLDDVPSGDKTLPWLYTTARHTLANNRRSGQRRNALTIRASNELALAIDAHARIALDFSPETALSDSAREALLALRDEEREALLLHAWEGLTPKEIGRVLGVNPTTARTRLHRARRKFAAEIEIGAGEPTALSPVLSQEDS